MYREQFDCICFLIDGTNMASLVNICFIYAITLSLFPSWFVFANIKVELTSPVHPVTLGGILAIQCQVQKMQNGFKVDLLRVLANGDTDLLAVRGNYVSQSSLGQRGFLAKRTFSDGSMVLFLTVVDVSPNDRGSYLCKVYSDLHGNYDDLARDSTDIEIYTFPSTLYPTCISVPGTRGTGKLTLTCTSEKGFPVAELNWSCSKNDVHYDVYDSQSEDSITSEISISVDATHNGVVFVCKLTSPGFPDRVRSCTYGPLTGLTNAGDKNIIVSTKPSLNVLQSSSNEGSHKIIKCNTSCPPDDPYTILYWAVACVGTTILMFIFLTTTIIYCCKYQTTSGEIVAAENSFTSCDGSEPVYVSLHRRQPEGNSMFMSVEDPNNPGNKVLMPREVFDEFYRSLSLKKSEHSH